MYWIKDGKLIVDEDGKPIDCETCPCDGAVPSDCMCGCKIKAGAKLSGTLTRTYRYWLLGGGDPEPITFFPDGAARPPDGTQTTVFTFHDLVYVPATELSCGYFVGSVTADFDDGTEIYNPARVYFASCFHDGVDCDLLDFYDAINDFSIEGALVSFAQKVPPETVFLNCTNKTYKARGGISDSNDTAEEPGDVGWYAYGWVADLTISELGPCDPCVQCYVLEFDLYEAGDPDTLVRHVVIELSVDDVEACNSWSGGGGGDAAGMGKSGGSINIGVDIAEGGTVTTSKSGTDPEGSYPNSAPDLYIAKNVTVTPCEEAP